MGVRHCPHCGKWVADTAEQCPTCREILPVFVRPGAAALSDGTREIRRGLLYMLLAAVFYYFAGGHNPLRFLFEIPPVVTSYLAPSVFVFGICLAAYGFYRRLLS
jgi:hypothetical protein